MKFKLMVIDDEIGRKAIYEKVLSKEFFEDPVYAWTWEDFIKNKETPFDGYLIDVFLWDDKRVSTLLTNELKKMPRLAPVFLVSKGLKSVEMRKVLNELGESSTKIIQYFDWEEFSDMEFLNENDKKLNAFSERLYNKLMYWHNPSVTVLKPDATIRILLLADPQYGDPKTSQTAERTEQWIWKVLQNRLNTEGEVIDLVVIAGDVSHSGRPDQFAFAKECLLNDLLLPMFNCNADIARSRLIIVPGNHDVNLRFSAVEGLCFNMDYKYKGIKGKESKDDSDLTLKKGNWIFKNNFPPLMDDNGNCVFKIDSTP